MDIESLLRDIARTEYDIKLLDALISNQRFALYASNTPYDALQPDDQCVSEVMDAIHGYLKRRRHHLYTLRHLKGCAEATLTEHASHGP